MSVTDNMLNSTITAKRHLVIVDAYTGFLEHLTDDRHEIDAAYGLGLPLAELADRLDVRITVLDWSEWYRFETFESSFARWISYPAAKPCDNPTTHDIRPVPSISGISRCPVPAINPNDGSPLHNGCSPLTYGLLAEGDPLFLLSYVLNDFLEQLHATDPVDAVLFPQFGGLGYVAQMARATGAGLLNISTGVVVTGTSVDRQTSNGEGHWTRPAIMRRQMEDMSLGLADLAICYGPCGEERARVDGLVRPVVRLPRRVDPSILEEISRARIDEAPPKPPAFFIHEPMQGATGSLLALDAVHELHHQGKRLSLPIDCSGRNMSFPPNLPRDFQGYWSGRGWVKELVERGCWRWSEQALVNSEARRVRLYPSLFEHLPEVWSEIARGTVIFLSREAAEGLAPGEELPPALMAANTLTPATLADNLLRLEAMDPAALDQARRDLCAAVLRAHSAEHRALLLDAGIAPLADLISGRLNAPRLGEVAQRLLDRRIDGRIDSEVRSAPDTFKDTSGEDSGMLAVAVACYEMGDLIVETVESVWASTRMPDELLLIDDGSRGEETLAAIERLEREARSRALPLSVIRQNNQGLASARNRALAETRSTYISFLDGDDLIGPDFYKLALDIVRANPELGGVAAWSETFGEGVPPGFWNAPQPELPLLLAENLVFVPCMSPVKLLRALGGYDIRQRYNYEDWELAIRLLAVGRPIVTIPRYLQRYRVRADSLLRTMSDVQNQVMREELFRNHRMLIEKFGPELSAQIENRLMRSQKRYNDALAEVSTNDALRLLQERATSRFGGMVKALDWRVRNYVRKGRRLR